MYKASLVIFGVSGLWSQKPKFPKFPFGHKRFFSQQYFGRTDPKQTDEDKMKQQKDENRRKKRTKLVLYSVFMGLSGLFTMFILLKYLYARARVHLDENNFSTMRRVSRARSVTLDHTDLARLQSINEGILRKQRQSIAYSTGSRRQSSLMLLARNNSREDILEK